MGGPTNFVERNVGLAPSLLPTLFDTGELRRAWGVGRAIRVWPVLWNSNVFKRQKEIISIDGKKQPVANHNEREQKGECNHTATITIAVVTKRMVHSELQQQSGSSFPDSERVASDSPKCRNFQAIGSL